MPKLYYLRTALGETSLLEEHQDLLESLLECNKTGLYPEKLAGQEGVWSFRTNKKIRVLFTTIQVQGKWYLLVLDKLTNHKYENNRFLRPGVLKNYLIKHHAEHLEWIDHWERLQDTQSEEKEGEDIEIGTVDYYKQEFIALDALQEQALTLSLPVLLTGVAGSGKSCLALSLFQTSLRVKEEKEEGLPFLYLSQSKALVSSVQKDWEALMALKGCQTARVQFKTYEELLSQQLNLQDPSFVGWRAFQTWYPVYLKKAQQTQAKGSKKKSTLPTPSTLSCEKVYQELRIVSGYTQEQYLNLGPRLSLAKTPEDRAWINQVYTDYLKELERKQEIDSGLWALDWKPQPSYALIFVDETQDLSYLSLRCLAALAVNHNLVFSMDPHQNLQHELSSSSYLTGLFGKKELTHVELELAHRFGLKIVQAANQVIALKRRLTGGSSDKKETKKINNSASDNPGKVFALSEEALNFCNAWDDSLLVVVTSVENLEEAQKRFPKLLVFTPETIKGLEYDRVLAYKLFPEDFFSRAHLRLQQLGEEAPLYRPKEGKADKQFILQLNRIYTAWTRAKKMLFLYENKNRHAEFFWKELEYLLEKGLPSEEELLGPPKAMSREDWLQELKKLLEAEQEDLAFSIAKRQLNWGRSQFQDYLSQHYHQPLVFAAAEAESVLPEPSKPPVPSKPPAPKPSKSSKNLEKLQKLPKSTTTTPSLQPTIPFSKKSMEEILAQGLEENFEGRLAKTLKQNINLKHLFLNSYTTKEGNSFVVAKSMTSQPEKMKLFSSCLANDLILLFKVPLADIRSYLIKVNLKNRESIEILDSLYEIQQKFMIISAQHGGIVYKKPAEAAVVLNSLSILSQLQKLGADFEQSPNELSLVHYAAAYGHAKLLKILVEHYHLNPDAVDESDGSTPAFCAVGENHIEVLNLLKTLGADFKKCKRNNVSLAHFAIEHSSLATLERVGILEPSLLTYVQNFSNNSNTPLMMAIVFQKKEHIDLLARRFNIDLDQEILGRTAVYLAAQFGYVEILDQLLTLGANAHFCLKNGSNLAHLAAVAGHVAVFPVLRKFNVDLNKATKDNITPAILAANQQRTDILVLLERWGVDLEQANDYAYSPAQLLKMHQGNVGIDYSPRFFDQISAMDESRDDETKNKSLILE